MPCCSACCPAELRRAAPRRCSLLTWVTPLPPLTACCPCHAAQDCWCQQALGTSCACANARLRHHQLLLHHAHAPEICHASGHGRGQVHGLVPCPYRGAPSPAPAPGPCLGHACSGRKERTAKRFMHCKCAANILCSPEQPKTWLAGGRQNTIPFQAPGLLARYDQKTRCTCSQQTCAMT